MKNNQSISANPSQQELRKKIQAIYNDQSIKNEEKAKLVQKLMSGNKAIKRQTSEGEWEDILDEDDSDYSNPLGCKHYRRGARMLAPCCNKLYSCRLCHDEVNNHVMDRHQVVEMMCNYCHLQQSSSQTCTGCKKSLGYYYCNKCNFWDDDQTKDIYHCNDCGICRMGKGLGIDFQHCDKCNLCMAKQLFNGHKCIENNSKSNCPVCGEYLFTSTKESIFMNCQHMIHSLCFQQLIRESYQCPICSKSLGDMTRYFELIDKELENPMPLEFRTKRSNIICCDCEKKSVTKYHFIYHACQHCGSYATKVMNTFVSNHPKAVEYGDLEEGVKYCYKGRRGEDFEDESSEDELEGETDGQVDDDVDSLD
ncbi:zf-CHY-domain-containing protein [Neoconidiobolus thromboides FSU 785]|nr:zf-CHY-domain-containing protein [Neoconidiobolus thromboides FSU 785]